jgi:hypothetical protein
MITFNRSQVVEAEFPDEKTVRFNAIQQDHIYSMEIHMDVRIADGQIQAIEGLMKRYTNFVCPRAVSILQTAVGISLREEGWDRRVMKEIGRLGCEHFAEIIIECCDVGCPDKGSRSGSRTVYGILDRRTFRIFRMKKWILIMLKSI